MAQRRTPADLPSSGTSPDEETEDSLRARWEASLRERFDEPIERATELTRQTLGWFPIRVWRHFLQHNGFLLAAGVSYQSLFTIFAVIYLAFAVAGLWLGGSPDSIEWLIDLINRYIPDLISENGLATPDQVSAIATTSGSTLLATGGIALVVAIWTSIGFVTYTRRAVRDTFGLPYDNRSYLLLKARDLFAALIFGVALIAGAILANLATWALRAVVSLVGIDTAALWSQLGVRGVSLIVAFIINAAALAALFRFLTGTSLRWRRIWPGSLIGGGAIVVLQIGAGLLLSYSPSNPLLATFAIFVGFLLWFRLNGVVILVAGAWIAVATTDRDLPLIEESELERERREHAALTIAAEIRVRQARAAAERARWWKRVRAERDLRRALLAQDELEASAPPPRKARFLD
ncbi:membrane protein [Microbacterium endophyticum]|uniref:Membrane protein n=1 Tax=Microbacterium endophyticum TaxID=1526412 RepID=A0A7W4V3Z8_9MICO|nr:YihY/virulence factor BrkB family protein [Microbacterium endophyticum]MBB2976395.1 membrane protein [Microbacterium endophyticum]NIK35276.1 membrane protein [Microbacterium endophyticum]